VRGVPKDLSKAIELYTKAANQGNKAAQNNLASMYIHGEGVPKDPSKAIELYTKAANQGDTAAQYELGYMYKTVLERLKIIKSYRAIH